MKSTTKIGSGRPQFILPGDRFINATKPLALSGKAHDQSLTRLEDKETVDERTCGVAKAR